MKALLRPFSTLSLTLAALVAGAAPLLAQEAGEVPASVPEGAGTVVAVPDTAGGAAASDPAADGSSESGETETPSLSAPEALRALWAAGGATDFSDEAWRGRLGVSLNRWDGVPGKNVADLTGSDAFYGAAAFSERLESPEYNPAQSIADQANGVRLRGLLIIPEDGEYSFALAADDSAELWLGEPGGSRFTKKKALSVPSWINKKDWSRYRTEAKSYKAGDVIWMEVIGKNLEGRGGGEHYSVGWKKPGTEGYVLIPPSLEDGRIVLTVPPVDPADPNDTGVPQEWLNSVGLGNLPAGHPDVRLYGDTDGDGFNLLQEYQTGGRPDAAGGNTGYFTVEKWTGVSAGSVEGFVKGERFIQAPNATRTQEGALDLADSGDNYFIRLRTQIVPPYSGEWTFFLAGDDTARLLLSPDGQRFLKRPIAEVNTWTNRYQWNKAGSQKSETKILQMETPYFLEALQYQQGGGAHVAVAWQYKAPNLCRMEGTTATQSSTFGGCPADWAIDGDMGTQSHTNWLTGNSWWQVEFPLPQALNQVVLYNRTDGANGQRLSNFRLSVLDENGQELAGQDFYTAAGTYAGATVTWNLPETVQGKTVKVQGLGLNAQGSKYLCLKEVEIYEQNEYSQGPVVITGDHLRTIPAEPNDTDGNSIPDDWQAEKGLVAGQNGLTEKDCSEYGDPDNDMAPNFAEYLLNTNPLVPSGIPGYLTQEMYWNVAGWSVDDAMKSMDVLAATPNRTLLKNGRPGQNVGENYLRRLRGTIKPPVTGEYTFWISSDETSVLYLSPDDRKFHKKEIARVGYGAEDRGVYLTKPGQWDAYPKQRSNPVMLEAGKEYFIEADHKQYHAIDHLQLAWQMPGGEREIIPGEYLSSFGGDLADRDDDDLPDDWETQYGIKADDNGGKDFNNGSWGDPYNTGITNREAYLLGWDPRQPSLPDFGESAVDVPVTSGTPGQGTWMPSGNGILTPMGRGDITYTVTLPGDGRYLLEITGSPTGNVLEVETLTISVTVDGHSLGSNTLRSLNGAAGRVLFLLPDLKAGSHTITITLRNTDLRRSFSIDGIRLLKPEGTSADGNALPEWLEQYLNQENALTNCPEASLTSPACVEGKARALHLTTLTAGGTPQTLQQGAGKGWYANVALPENGEPVNVQAGFESGATAAASTIKWEPCDVLVRPEMTIRTGDSLRLTVGANGTGENGEGTNNAADTSTINSSPSFPVTFTIGNRTVETTSDKPVAMKFDTAGTQTVRADWRTAGGSTGTTVMEVHVTGVELGEAKDLITGLRRTITLENMPEGILLQNAAPLRVDKALGTVPAGTRKLLVSSEEGGAQHLVARLGESGPIIDTLAFFSHDNSGTSTLSRIETVQQYGDGSSLVCLYLASESLPEGGYIKITMTAGGAQFLEGGTELIVRSEDFGADGLYRVLMTAPRGTSTSICHIIRYYDKDGKEL